MKSKSIPVRDLKVLIDEKLKNHKEITSDMMSDLFEKYGDTIDYDPDRHTNVIISKSTRRKRYFGR